MTAGKAVKGGGKTGAKGGNKRVRTADDGGSGAAEGLSAEASSSSGSALSTSDASLSAPPVKKEPKKSTAVYVTGLPLDTTSAEIASVFSKCGIILLGADDLPRVKLYNDVKTGAFKGEALVMYFKESSVELAERVMDDTEFRLGQSGRMRVKRAEWGDGDGGGDGESKADAGKEKSREKKRMTEEEKRALHARMRKMESSVTPFPCSCPCSACFHNNALSRTRILTRPFARVSHVVRSPNGTPMTPTATALPNLARAQAATAPASLSSNICSLSPSSKRMRRSCSISRRRSATKPRRWVK